MYSDSSCTHLDIVLNVFPRHQTQKYCGYMVAALSIPDFLKPMEFFDRYENVILNFIAPRCWYDFGRTTQSLKKRFQCEKWLPITCNWTYFWCLRMQDSLCLLLGKPIHNLYSLDVLLFTFTGLNTFSSVPRTRDETPTLSRWRAGIRTSKAYPIALFLCAWTLLLRPHLKIIHHHCIMPIKLPAVQCIVLDIQNWPMHTISGVCYTFCPWNWPRRASTPLTRLWFSR